MQFDVADSNDVHFDANQAEDESGGDKQGALEYYSGAFAVNSRAQDQDGSSWPQQQQMQQLLQQHQMMAAMEMTQYGMSWF